MSQNNTNFQHFLFSQTWPNGFCHENNCNTDPPNYFTIHGLWPVNSNGKPLMTEFNSSIWTTAKSRSMKCLNAIDKKHEVSSTIFFFFQFYCRQLFF